MQLVQHHPPQGGEEMLPIGARQQERQLLGRGEQDLRGIAPLALALGGGGVAGARLHPHPQAHLRNGRLQIARDINGQRLQGRDVEGVQALTLGAFARRKLDQAGQEARQGLARARGGDEQGAAALLRQFQQGELMRARSPAARGEPGGEGSGQNLGAARHGVTLGRWSLRGQPPFCFAAKPDSFAQKGGS